MRKEEKKIVCQASPRFCFLTVFLLIWYYEMKYYYVFSGSKKHLFCYTQNMKALGLVVLEKIPIVSLWELMTPGVGPSLTPGAWLAGFMKRTTVYTLLHRNMKALGLVVS